MRRFVTQRVKNGKLGVFNQVSKTCDVDKQTFASHFFSISLALETLHFFWTPSKIILPISNVDFCQHVTKRKRQSLFNLTQVKEAKLRINIVHPSQLETYTSTVGRKSERSNYPSVFGQNSSQLQKSNCVEASTADSP